MAEIKKARQENLGEHGHLLCWTGVGAGVLIALMGFVVFMTLGAVVAGVSFEGFAMAESAPGLGLFTTAGLWIGISMILSLFLGTFFAVRTSRFVTGRVGAAHGFVVATLFFALAMFMGATGVGGAMAGLGTLAKGASTGTSNIGSNPFVQDTVHKAIGNSNLKSPLPEVAQGLSLRLMQGDRESAKEYLAFQTGKSPEELDERVETLRADFERAAKRVSETAAKSLLNVSLILLVVLLAGMLGAVLGGIVGAQANYDRPLAKSAVLAVGVRAERGGVLPYVFGWLVGVPVSLLMVIAIVRSVF